MASAAITVSFSVLQGPLRRLSSAPHPEDEAENGQCDERNNKGHSHENILLWRAAALASETVVIPSGQADRGLTVA